MMQLKISSLGTRHCDCEDFFLCEVHITDLHNPHHPHCHSINRPVECIHSAYTEKRYKHTKITFTGTFNDFLKINIANIVIMLCYFTHKPVFYFIFEVRYVLSYIFIYCIY